MSEKNAECPECGHEAAWSTFQRIGECPECRTVLRELHRIATVEGGPGGEAAL